MLDQHLGEDFCGKGPWADRCHWVNRRLEFDFR
jgi:hypothetical protein